MCELSGSETKVALAIFRKTYGHQISTDRIALSQIQKLTGLGKNTIIKAIRSLVRRKIIKKYDETIPHQYSMIIPENIDTGTQKTKKSNSKSGSENEPSGVQKSNQSPVQKLNTQKKVPKENLKETTTSSSDLSDDIIKVIETWNTTFERKMHTNNNTDIEMVKYALNEFSVDQILEAIFNRSQAPYYKTIPWHRDNPEMFFCIPRYITNDLHRKPDDVITYEKMVDKVASSGLTTNDYEMVDHVDSDGKRMWRKKYNG